MNMKVTSIFFQSYAGLSNPSPDHPVQHVFGKTSMDEKLGKCIFQISPGAFFQVTTEGAEVLYDVVVKNVKEVTENPKDTVLFDVCCGTGTIGLTCMKEGAVGKVVGIDISEPAIKDAKINAEKNGYSGSDDVARFVASRAELVMAEETRKVDCAMVAVVDPARDGLHSDVLRALRNKRKIQRIVYVSCNPTGSLIKDAAAFCAPPTKKYREAPFKITSAQPVDMFPYTPHCEMVLVFDRMTEEELAIENATESVK
uniref:Methyltransferase domain-containing protein n=1 Tax=Eucampia antarctica TaxID=49252 RepID=A0A6U0TIE3_9STRA